MQRDPLSDILNLADAHCVVSGKLIAGGTWATRLRRSVAIKFCAVVEGSCWLTTDKGTSSASFFDSGDVIIIHGGPSLILASAPEQLSTAPSHPLPRDKDGNLLAGRGSDFVMIAGLVEIDARRCDLLLNSLPSVIHIRGNEEPAQKLSWLLTSLEQESARQCAGRYIAIDHLAKLMFVEALRLYLADREHEKFGWLAALSDDRISIALRNIHSNPAHPWTVGELAKLTGMSRTSFALKFRAVSGMPPLSYVLHWRIRLAETELIRTKRSLAEIAWAIGYGSESAFSNAFTKVTGLSPGRFRRASISSGEPAHPALHVD